MKTSQFVSLLIPLIATKEVSTWTIDLPEVRKYFFEKYSSDDRNNLVESNRKSFDNVHGNSPLNSPEYGHHDHNVEYYERNTNNGGNEVYQHGKYASGFEYQSYMEKKVLDIVHNGSAYLEGLSRAIQDYTQVLQECSRDNLTDNETPLRANGTLGRAERCERASRASEHVRRLAELALWAARELQDRDYAQHYQSASDQDKEENELLLRLAWFLDRLALLTGFEPGAEPYVPTATTRGPTSPPTPFTLLPVPEDVKNSMMGCMTGGSDAPAYDRCRYPLPLPDGLRRLFNITDTPPTSSEMTSEGPMSTPSAGISDSPTPSPPELLVPSENRRLSSLPPELTAVKSVKKRSIADNPLLNVIKYYVKHKLWTNSNAELDDNTENFDLDNNLAAVKSVQKRSIDNKKSKIHQPENPMQDISNYIKHKNGIRYVKDKSQADKVRLYLDKIRHSDSLTVKDNVRKLEKSFKRVQKRSVHYEKMLLPRVAENPMKDISFYIKNKPGTNYENDLVQAAQVRAGLEQVFQTGNIEVIRRYGANYNPAVPNPLLDGIMRSMADV